MQKQRSIHSSIFAHYVYIAFTQLAINLFEHIMIKRLSVLTSNFKFRIYWDENTSTESMVMTQSWCFCCCCCSPTINKQFILAQEIRKNAHTEYNTMRKADKVRNIVSFIFLADFVLEDVAPEQAICDCVSLYFKIHFSVFSPRRTHNNANGSF